MGGVSRRRFLDLCVGIRTLESPPTTFETRSQTLPHNAAIASSSGITHAEVNDAIAKAFDDNRAVAIWANGSPTEHAREEEKEVIADLKNKLQDLAKSDSGDPDIERAALAAAHELLGEIDIVSHYCPIKLF